MSKPKITLYLDVVSPFAYIAFHVLQNSPIFKNCEITYIPIFLGGLMHACGNTPPIQIKNKDKFINVERLRWARYFSVPLSKEAPPGFPIQTLPLQRVLSALSLSHPDSVPAFFALAYHNMWVHYAEPTKPENMLAMVATVLGSADEAAKVLEASREGAAKKKLVENTDAAFKDGAFGLPWFVATNAKGETEGFWGVDHMGQLIDHLGLERPKERAWRAVL